MVNSTLPKKLCLVQFDSTLP